MAAGIAGQLLQQAELVSVPASPAGRRRGGPDPAPPGAARGLVAVTAGRRKPLTAVAMATA